MKKESFFNWTERKENRQELRNNPTPAEVELWKCIRKRRVNGLKFRRQFGVGPYVLDFYCPELRLAIELDGSVHDSPEAIAYDKERSDYLTENFGIHILRFRNRQVFEEMPLVIWTIRKACERLNSLSRADPLSRAERDSSPF